jgi:hypothetical protein
MGTPRLESPPILERIGVADTGQKSCDNAETGEKASEARDVCPLVFAGEAFMPDAFRHDHEEHRA